MRPKRASSTNMMRRRRPRIAAGRRTDWPDALPSLGLLQAEHHANWVNVSLQQPLDFSKAASCKRRRADGHDWLPMASLAVGALQALTEFTISTASRAVNGLAWCRRRATVGTDQCQRRIAARAHPHFGP
jgi:hypothetical protein